MHFGSKISDLTLAAVNAALEAGQLLKKGYGSHFFISSKPGSHNLVTEYDKMAEKGIISALLNQFPDHSILAEESGASEHSEGSPLWIIDPLDGTVNFAHQIPVFCVSIAAVIEKKIVAGVIYQPITQELFVAEKGRGAYLNGVKIHVSAIRHRKESFLATGFPYNVHENPLHCVDVVADMIKEGIPIRRLGSAALDLAYTAVGRFDAYWEVGLNPWDIAAGQLIVEEAGGRVTGYDGSHREILSNDPILASNGLIHREMSEKLTSYYQ